jgi:prolyl 4-hydroxylase
MKYLTVFFIFCLTSVINCEFYSSIDKLLTLFDSETDILSDFQEITDEVESIKTYLEQKLTPWIVENNEAQNDKQAYVTNMLNAFLMLKRNIVDLDMISTKLTEFIEGLQGKVKKIKEKALTDTDEVIGAVGGIIRAQKAYQLRSEDLVEGIVDGLQTRKPLSPHDIYVLGSAVTGPFENAFFMKNYLEIAKLKVEAGLDHLNEVNMTEVEEEMASLPENFADPFDETYQLKDDRDGRSEKMLMQKACRGNLTRSPAETKNLRCRMVSFSAFSMIGPFKLEEASIEPYVVIYHEVLSDAEVDRLIEIARQKQSKAMVGAVNGNGIKPRSEDESRLAQLMWMYNIEYPREAGVLNVRFEDMTGLSMETSEPLQIQNYGVGGHYYSHYDVFGASPDMDISRLHRTATLMLYVNQTLSDPFRFSSVLCFSCRTSKKEAQQSFHI